MKPVILALALQLTGCAWFTRTATDVGECGFEAIKDAEYMAHVRRVLADPSSYLAELTRLGLEIGNDAVDCLVRRWLTSDALGAGSEDEMVRENARKWLGR